MTNVLNDGEPQSLNDLAWTYAPCGMFAFDNNTGILIDVNPAAAALSGFSKDELIGTPMSDLHPHAEREQVNAEFLNAEQRPSGHHGFHIQRKDGQCVPVMISSSKSVVLGGRPVSIYVYFDPIAHGEQVKHLAQMEARYRGLMEAAPDGMVVVNESGEIVLLNARAESQFGYRRDELLGQKVTSIIPEGFAERLIADALRSTAEALAQQIGTGIELNGRRKDGSSFPIEIMLSPLESAEGVLVTAAIRDISERKQLARQLHQSQKMEAVGQLTGGIAHDFNNLLGVIIGNLDLLDRLVAGNEAAVKRVKTAQKAASRGADITRRLLAFSSNQELKPALVLLRDSIQNTIELATGGLGPEIKITTHLDESVPPLFVDPAGLESSLLNLVVNARDAMPKGGSIIISSELLKLSDTHPMVLYGDIKEGRFVCIRVSDSGHGMSKETLERVFEPFFTTKPRNKGTGLGLAMVYGFVNQSGGTVQVYSELGHGTTVSLYLPIIRDHSHTIPAEAEAPLNTQVGGTVLVVDDEVDLLEIAAAYLADMGLTALKAVDGASALQTLAKRNEIDLMVTDIVMPGGMNGVELVERARILRPHLKIIYSSGFPAEALAERSMPLEDDSLLRKPYLRAEFIEIVRRVMGSAHATQTQRGVGRPIAATRSVSQ